MHHYVWAAKKYEVTVSYNEPLTGQVGAVMLQLLTLRALHNSKLNNNCPSASNWTVYLPKQN